jgi:hypothetical protein
MQVFAKRTLRYDPIAQPYVTFATEKDRDDLIRASQPGDLLVFAGSLDDQTHSEDRGRLLGMAEFSHAPIATASGRDQAAFAGFEPQRNDASAQPGALPLTRAWCFQHSLKLIDTLREQLTFEATAKAIRLDDDDTRTVLALPRVEIPMNPVPAADAGSTSNPTTGPLPVAWIGEVTRSARDEAYTYVLRFGERDIWKVGHTQNLAARLAEINQHVPHEELGERWGVVLHCRWSCSMEAYQMEQGVLGSLNSYRTQGERVRCTDTALKAAWFEFMLGKQPGCR